MVKIIRRIFLFNVLMKFNLTINFLLEQCRVQVKILPLYPDRQALFKHDDILGTNRVFTVLIAAGAFFISG